MARLRLTYKAFLLIGVSLLLGAGQRAAAQGSEHYISQPWEVTWQLREWQKDYDALVAALRENTPKSNKHVRKRAHALYEDILDHAIHGPEFFETVGRFLTVLAISEVRLGDRDAGAWHWQMAQSVFPELRKSSFEEVPDVAPFMKDSLVMERGSEDLLRFSNGASGEEMRCPGSVHPAVPKTEVPARYPAGLGRYKVAGTPFVRTVIDIEGKAHEPVVEKGSGFVSFDLAAMECLRNWVFEPAMCGGRPIPAYMTVSVEFGKRH
ncbi:MAG: energy transducer TonB [Thermoanaerobaculaceae bacterium]|jgi:TonB family protein